MPELEHLYETLGKKEINNDFRLWLTSLPTNVLPHNVVLRGKFIKIYSFENDI